MKTVENYTLLTVDQGRLLIDTRTLTPGADIIPMSNQVAVVPREANLISFNVLPEYCMSDMLDWAAGGDPGDPYFEKSRKFFEDACSKQVHRYSPLGGFMLLQNELMDSSKFGKRYLLPFGEKCSRVLPTSIPFSIDGTASGTVCVKGVCLWAIEIETTNHEKNDSLRNRNP